MEMKIQSLAPCVQHQDQAGLTAVTLFKHLQQRKRSICPSDDPLGLGWRPGLPEDVQVSVAGSLSVLQVLAQIIDRFDIAARFAFDARVAQVADQPV